MSDLPVATINRIVKKHGVERIGGDATAKLVELTEAYIAKISTDAKKLADHAGRKTLKADDIALAASSA